MKNILIVIASLKHGGGAEKVASTVGNGLLGLGHNVQFLTFYNSDNKYLFNGVENCENELLSNNIFIKLYKLFYRAYKIRQICRKEKIDVSISFMEEANFSNILSKVFINNAKIIVSIRQSVNAWGLLYRKLIKLLYNKADIIVPIVEEEKDNLIKNYGISMNKIQVINNPIYITKIDELKNESLGDYEKLFTNNKFTFVNVGRLSYQKNQSLLIKIFQKFNLQYPNCQLLIIGEGDLIKELESEIGESENIYLLGNQTNPYKFMNNSDCFVFTSRFEGMPGAVLEALACGLPVISTDCSTGPKEILKSTLDTFSPVNTLTQEEFGILVPVNNEQEIYNAMELIYNDDNLRNNYKIKSLERAKDFEINIIIEKWEGIL